MKYDARTQVFMIEDFACHQSDVIKKLVKALEIKREGSVV